MRPKYILGIKITLINIIVVIFGIYSVKFISIPIFLTFRRGGLITTFLISYLIYNVKLTEWNLFKMTLVACGMVISGYVTFNRDWLGFCFIWLNNISQSYYSVYVNKVNRSNTAVGVSPFEINAYYAYLSFPLYLGMAIGNGELLVLIEELMTSDKSFQLAMLLLTSGILGIAITLSTLLVVVVCSPFSLNVSGNIKNALSAIISFFIFDDLIPSPQVLLGISIGFFGSCLHMRDELLKFKVKT